MRPRRKKRGRVFKRFAPTSDWLREKKKETLDALKKEGETKFLSYDAREKKTFLPVAKRKRFFCKLRNKKLRESFEGRHA